MDGMSQRMQGATPDQESYSKMGAPPPVGGWKVDRVEIRPAENGGFIASCSKTRQRDGDGTAGGHGPMPTSVASDYQNKEYAFASVADVHAFIDKEFGGGEAAMPDAETAMAASDMENGY